MACKVLCLMYGILYAHIMLERQMEPCEYLLCVGFFRCLKYKGKYETFLSLKSLQQWDCIVYTQNNSLAQLKEMTMAQSVLNVREKALQTKEKGKTLHSRLGLGR